MRLIFSNCYRFNPPASDIVRSAKSLQVRVWMSFVHILLISCWYLSVHLPRSISVGLLSIRTTRLVISCSHLKQLLVLKAPHNNNNNNNNLLFIHIRFNCERFTKVRAMSSSRTPPHPSHLTQSHPHAVRCKVIIIISCRLVPYWREFLGVSWSWTRNSNLPFVNTWVSPKLTLNWLSYQDQRVFKHIKRFLLLLSSHSYKREEGLAEK